MVTKFYKVYTASQYDSLDLSLYETNHRWNKDTTEVILEFKEKPHGNTVVLTHSEAVALMSTDPWRYEDDIFETEFDV